MCLASGSIHGTVYSLEACPRQREIAGAELKKAGAGNVELIEGDFREVLPDLLKRIDQVDLVYFDGDHSKDSLIWQFRTCLEKADHLLFLC
jgi:predicted O-methyltransferase YrrM